MVIDHAVDLVGHPLLHRYRRAILLGAIREDYWYVPLLDQVIEQPSLTHFYGPGLPGGFFPFLTFSARTRASHCYRRALVEANQGRTASAFVQLGRAAHLLIDMGCPVHVHRVAHETDPYEWYVEAHRAELQIEPVPPSPDAITVAELVAGLASFTQGFAADKTNSVHGRILRRFGLRRPLSRETVAEQARRIIPMTTSYLTALLRLFLAQSDSIIPTEKQPSDRERHHDPRSDDRNAG